MQDSLVVDKGFHFYLNKKDALRSIDKADDRWKKNKELRIVKMYVRKEDIIAKGENTWAETVFRSLVATQAFWKG